MSSRWRSTLSPRSSTIAGSLRAAIAEITLGEMAHAGGCGTSCSCPCMYEARSIAPMQKRASGPCALVAAPCAADACIGSQDILRHLTAQLRAVRDKATCTAARACLAHCVPALPALPRRF
eukprot:scaffold25171_cov62-Phaeocystis_antarctica.AAC.1